MKLVHIGEYVSCVPLKCITRLSTNSSEFVQPFGSKMIKLCGSEFASIILFSKNLSVGNGRSLNPSFWEILAKCTWGARGSVNIWHKYRAAFAFKLLLETYIESRKSWRYVYKLVDKKEAWLPCWRPGGQQMSHHR